MGGWGNARSSSGPRPKKRASATLSSASASYATRPASTSRWNFVRALWSLGLTPLSMATCAQNLASPWRYGSAKAAGYSFTASATAFSNSAVVAPRGSRMPVASR